MVWNSAAWLLAIASNNTTSDFSNHHCNQCNHSDLALVLDFVDNLKVPETCASPPSAIDAFSTCTAAKASQEHNILCNASLSLSDTCKHCFAVGDEPRCWHSSLDNIPMTRIHSDSQYFSIKYSYSCLSSRTHRQKLL